MKSYAETVAGDVTRVRDRQRLLEDMAKARREGLVPKKVTVTKKGKTFQQTVYVRPGEKPEAKKPVRGKDPSPIKGMNQIAAEFPKGSQQSMAAKKVYIAARKRGEGHEAALAAGRKAGKIGKWEEKPAAKPEAKKEKAIRVTVPGDPSAGIRGMSYTGTPEQIGVKMAEGAFRNIGAKVSDAVKKQALAAGAKAAVEAIRGKEDPEEVHEAAWSAVDDALGKEPSVKKEREELSKLSAKFRIPAKGEKAPVKKKQVGVQKKAASAVQGLVSQYSKGLSKEASARVARYAHEKAIDIAKRGGDASDIKFAVEQELEYQTEHGALAGLVKKETKKSDATLTTFAETMIGRQRQRRIDAIMTGTRDASSR